MLKLGLVVITGLTVLFVSLSGTARAQSAQRPATEARRSGADARSQLTGIYRIDMSRSDKLYSVVAGASSNLPFGEQQRFFIDLAVRLTPPDLLAIERRGRNITIGSSRASRITLVADGVTHAERAGDGHIVRSRVSLEGEKLIFTSHGKTEDNFSVIFAPINGGRRLRVTRRISAEQLNEPVIIQTIYNKISDNARWDIYGESQVAGEVAGADGVEEESDAAPRTAQPKPASVSADSDKAELLRDSLHEWVEATNGREIEKQMSFYMPELRAYYLTRNVTRSFVRIDKARAFAGANLIDIKAEEPEIIFLDGGRTAVMRFRKKYRIEGGARNRRGEVVQELRWQQTQRGWKIFSERDIRVIR